MRILSVFLVLGTLAGPLLAQEPAPPPGPVEGAIRQGFWIGLGLGAGSAGVNCSNFCPDDREIGLTGYVRLGGSLSRRVLVGVEYNGWYHGDETLDQNVSFLSAVALWYPGARLPLYIKLGIGGMAYDGETAADDDLTATAPSGMLGIGYEVLIGRNFSVVPFINMLGSTSVRAEFNDTPLPLLQEVRVNVLQIGVGAGWH